MDYTDIVLYNDEQREQLEQADRVAHCAWRFRNLRRPVGRLLTGVGGVIRGTAAVLGDVVEGALDAGRRWVKRAGDHGSPTLPQPR